MNKTAQLAVCEPWTKQEAADYFRVTPRTIDRWLQTEVIPREAKVIIGGRVRFRSQVLTEIISVVTK